MVRAVLVVLVVAGCGGRTPGPITPGGVWIANIRVDGNAAISDDDLVDKLALDRVRRDGRGVDLYLLSLDTRRIRAEYGRKGFFDAKVDARVDRDDNAETVVFTVVEGWRAKARVAVTGLPPEISEAQVLEKLKLKEGAPYDYELFHDGKDIVRNLVEEAGYAHAVDDSVVTVDRGARVAAASYRIDPGPRAAFGKVTIAGIAEDNDLYRAILGRVTFVEGDVFSRSVLTKTQDSLYELARLSNIRVEPDLEGQSPTVPITIRVSFAGGAEFRAGFGAGYDPTTYELRARGGYSWIPHDAPLWQLAADGRIAAAFLHSGDDGKGFFEPFRDPDFKLRLLASAQRIVSRPRLVADGAGGIDFFTVEAYTAKGLQARLGVSRPLGVRWLTARVGWAWSRLDFSTIDEAISDRKQNELGLRDAQILGKYEQAIAADKRDNPLDPRSGWYATLRLAEGTIAAGGAFDYFEVQPEFRHYVALGRTVLSWRVRGGAILGEVPITERYFSGGPQNHRGFGTRGLAPVASQLVDIDPQDPSKGTRLAEVRIGGSAFLEAGAEIRIPIRETHGVLFGSTLFLDGGDVVEAPSDLALDNLHWATGIGLFVKYGGFKVRFDFAERITRRASGGLWENLAFSFGVGETF